MEAPSFHRLQLPLVLCHFSATRLRSRDKQLVNRGVMVSIKQDHTGGCRSLQRRGLGILKGGLHEICAERSAVMTSVGTENIQERSLLTLFLIAVVAGVVSISVNATQFHAFRRICTGKVLSSYQKQEAMPCTTRFIGLQQLSRAEPSLLWQSFITIR